MNRQPTWPSQKWFSLFAAFLFVFLFVYLVLRAIYNEPLLDELITYSNYIQSGQVHNHDIAPDSNNHLLNTYLCSLVYLFSGDHFFWMRLPSLLAFGLYFYSCYQLCRSFSHIIIRYTGLVAFTCLPYVTEYFAFCRGYGLSFAFLFFGILHLKKYLEGSSGSFKWMLFSLVLSAMANLSLLPFAVMVSGYALIVSFTRKSQSGQSVIWQFIVPVFIFLCGVLYLLLFALNLKKAGALYWGGTGLWSGTGISLKNGLLYGSADAWKWIILSLILLFILHLIRNFRLRKFRSLNEPHAAFAVLFLGLLASLILSFHLFGLKYPIERGALHIVLLFLLCFVFIADNYKAGKWLGWLFAYFAFPFIVNMSLFTSLNSTGDRITKDFYERIQPHLAKGTILCDALLSLPLYYHQLKRDQFYFAAADGKLPSHSDLWLTRKDLHESVPDNYALIAEDETTGDQLYKRTPSKTKKIVSEGLFRYLKQNTGTNTYSIIPENEYQLTGSESVQFDVNGQFVSNVRASNLQLVVTATDKNNQPCYYSFTHLRLMFQDRKLNANFRINAKLDGLKGTEKKINFFLWSPAGEKLIIKNLHYKVSIIE